MEMATLEEIRELLNPKDLEMVLYHHPCYDGFGAAFSAWKLLGSRAQYIPIVYGKSSESFKMEQARGKNVVILDVSFDRERTIQLQQIAKTLVVLDHHKTSFEALKDIQGCYFEMNRSGAGIAWEFFHGQEHLPTFLKYIQDRDLWKFHFKDSAAFNSYLICTPLDFQVYNEFLDQNCLQEAVEVGKKFLEFVEAQVIQDSREAVFKKIETYKVLAIDSRHFVSELGGKLAENPECDFAFIFYYDVEKMAFKVSLRANGKVDVGKVASTYGGGGHANASGFWWKGDISELLKD